MRAFLFATLLIFLASGCRLGGNSTTTAEYPEIILPMYKIVSAESLPLLELPLFVYDMENPSKSGFPKFKWITALYPLPLSIYPEGLDVDSEDDLQISCLLYTSPSPRDS